MQKIAAELAHDSACILGEGPVWWEDALWFVDIEGRAIHRFAPGNRTHQVFGVPGRTGFTVPTTRGRWLIAQNGSIADYRPGEGEPRVIVSVAPDESDIRFNDAKSDPAGRLFAGTMHLDAQHGAGALYRLDHDAAEVTRAAENVTISNGLAWHEPGGTMYYIDTPTQQIDAFDWCRDTGEIRNRRTVATLKGGSPDGMCIDCDGQLWVAMWGGSRVARINPQSGRETGAVTLPCTNVTSCCFGGQKLDQLWITSARIGVDEARLANQATAGGLFVADVGVAGLPTVPVA